MADALIIPRATTAHHWTPDGPRTAISLCGRVAAVTTRLRVPSATVPTCTRCARTAADGSHPPLSLSGSGPDVVRAWALGQGMRPSRTGPISDAIAAAYKAAHANHLH